MCTRLYNENKVSSEKEGIGWNFAKFLIDREGNLVSRFEPTVDMADVKAAIEAQL